MSLDRPDLRLALKDVLKAMANPCERDIGQLKRLGRYLKMYRTCAVIYVWQDLPASLDGYSDADGGGDLYSGRSTSGGCLLHGGHLINHWS